MSSGLSPAERVNIVILALKKVTINVKLVADGEVGHACKEAVEKLWLFAKNGSFVSKTEELNLLILVLKAAGFNDDLVADGVVGPQLKKALNSFLQLGGFQLG